MNALSLEIPKFIIHVNGSHEGMTFMDISFDNNEEYACLGMIIGLREKY